MAIGENVGEVDTGTGSDRNSDGLTAEEQSQFDQMMRDGGNQPPERDGAGEGDIAAADDDSGDDNEDDDAAVGDREPAPDAVARDAPKEGDAPRPNPKTISYGKYQREQRKAAEKADKLAKDLADERTQRVRLDERTRMLMEAINSKAAPAPAPAAAAEPDDPEPNADEDFVAHAAWTSRELKRTQALIKDRDTAYQNDRTQTAAEREEQNIYRTFSSDLERAASSNPEYAEAFVHLRESRFTELGFVFAGIDINDPEQCATLSQQEQTKLSDNIQRAFYADQMEVARAALKSGKSPAEQVRHLARARGYAPKPPASGGGERRAAPATNGTAPAARAAAAPPASVKDQLAAVREGQKTATSLSDAGGSPGGSISPERLAAMSDEEFTEFYDSMSKGQFDRVVLSKPANS
jgi:hypothetical protein